MDAFLPSDVRELLRAMNASAAVDRVAPRPFVDEEADGMTPRRRQPITCPSHEHERNADPNWLSI